MRLWINTQPLWLLLLILQSVEISRQSKTERWRSETLGQTNTISDNNDSKAELNTYKQNLLKYVLQTDEPRQVTDDIQVPYIMDRLYTLIADKSTGREKRSAPFEVDYIRGLEDHYETSRRMQFWFNLTAVNETEDVIECYFHIYKKRAPIIQTLRSHTVTVALYKVVDESEMFQADGEIGPGVVLLDQQIVSAYTGQWIVFKSNLKDTVKEWTRNPRKNKGFLLTAVDHIKNHVNGTHIDFVQRGENPKSQQPVFVVYTDQVKKKNSKHKKRHRKNIDYLIKNFLNEDSRVIQRNRERCVALLGEDNSETTDDCTELLLRQKRGSIDHSVNIADEITQTKSKRKRSLHRERNRAMADEPSSSRRRSRRRHNKHLSISANRRANSFCQVVKHYISFQELGWGKWIVAPDGVNANFCDGKCPFPLTSTLTASNHAVLQSVANYYHPEKVKPPCCVPQKLSRMTILYHQDNRIVTIKNYDNMIVESCGCR